MNGIDDNRETAGEERPAEEAAEASAQAGQTGDEAVRAEEAEGEAEAGTSADVKPPHAGIGEDVRKIIEETETEALKKALAEEKDRAVRLYADFENFRRRTAKERAETYQRARAAVYEELLPVIDNFARAMAQAGDDPFANGVKMVFGQLSDFLRKGGVETIEAVGKAFDPAVHEAVAYQPSAEAAEGIVIYETRKGYKMGDQVIRPASVIVSSGAPQTAGDETAEVPANGQ